MVYAFNPSTRKAEADGSLWVWDQPGLQSEFQDSQGCLEDPVSKKINMLTDKLSIHVFFFRTAFIFSFSGEDLEYSSVGPGP